MLTVEIFHYLFLMFLLLILSTYNSLMGCKLSICVVISADSIATEENAIHIGIVLQLLFVLLHFPGRLTILVQILKL